MTDCKNCKYTDEYCASGDCPHDKTNYDILKEYEAHQTPVPSYDELQNMNKAVNECMAANIKLVEQNKELKELLKECRSFIEYVNAWDYGYELLDKIEEVLK